MKRGESRQEESKGTSGSPNVPAGMEWMSWVMIFSMALTCSLPTGTNAQETGVESFSWLAGTWQGSGPEGSLAEIHYMEPRAGHLPSVLRLTQNGRVAMLETLALVEEDDGLRLYVRHFDSSLVPLEEEGAIELRLVEVADRRFVFENSKPGSNPQRTVLTRTEAGFASVSYLARPDGSVDELRVSYERVDR